MVSPLSLLMTSIVSVLRVFSLIKKAFLKQTPILKLIIAVTIASKLQTKNSPRTDLENTVEEDTFMKIDAIILDILIRIFKAIIEVRNVNKSYGGKRVLKNVSFAVKPGIHGFIGPNGAGKTTTLGIIVRLVVPNSGEVFNEHLGFVPAEPLFPALTVENYVLDCGYLRDIPKAEVLAKLDSSPLSNHRNKKYEPFNGLDPTFRRDLFDNLVNIKKQGGTILISTHILSDLQKLADEITMIRDGEIVYSGPKTGDIEETYEEYFVKRKQGMFEL
ncbi:9339_t:CDS:2 [Funneliformis geosporum]|nr:9339_t:CDS:2 [Funneliformis geosporum]